MKICDIAEERELSLQEFWEDETPEDVQYFIDLKINLIIDEIKHKTLYQEIKDMLFDSEISFDESFFQFTYAKSCSFRRTIT